MTEPSTTRGASVSWAGPAMLAMVVLPAQSTSVPPQAVARLFRGPEAAQPDKFFFGAQRFIFDSRPLLFDADADGDLDAVIAYVTGVNLWVNRGNGEMSRNQMPSAQPRAGWGFASGDVDGDGDTDLVMAVPGGVNVLFLNDGQGNFTEDLSGRLPAHSDFTLRVALVDVDADTDLDLIAVNGSGQQDRLYVNDGTGRFTDVTAAQMPPDAADGIDLATGDLDGDGDVDFIVANGFGYSVIGRAQPNSVYLNDGLGGFSYGVISPTVAEHTNGVALGDVDGDGDLDAVCSNVSVTWVGGTTRLYLNTGMGAFVEAPGRIPGPSWPRLHVRLLDYDRDGDLDILEGNRQARLYTNDGMGTFTDATDDVFPPTLRPLAWELGDMDGDGDVDLVAPHHGGPTQFHGYALYLNLTRQILTPLQPPAIGGRYTLDLHAQGGDIVFPLLATASRRTPVPPFGTLHLDPAQTTVLTPLVMPPSRFAQVSLPVPENFALVGVTLYAQGLVVDASGLGRHRLTGFMVDVIR